jgi:hypothetical protein
MNPSFVHGVGSTPLKYQTIGEALVGKAQKFVMRGRMMQELGLRQEATA